MQSPLGLPLEYSTLHSYFDAHNILDDTHSKNCFIESILKKHNTHTVLDLTCGTGSQVFFLNHRGYKVIGADISPPLLQQARKRAQSENKDITFIDGDMRTLEVGQFDAVITIFNAIAHLTKPDFERALNNIHNNLKVGGIYVFDILNLQVMTDEAVENLKMDWTKEVNGNIIHNIQYSTLDRKAGRLTSFDSYVIQEGSKTRKLKNQFTLQLYTAQELREILAQNGFDVRAQYDLDGTDLIEEKSTNILTVAMKHSF